jgi:hypothetical protein
MVMTKLWVDLGLRRWLTLCDGQRCTYRAYGITHGSLRDHAMEEYTEYAHI